MFISGIRAIHAIPLDRLTVLIHFFDNPQCEQEGSVYEQPNWVRSEQAPELVKTVRRVHRVELVQKIADGTAKVVEVPGFEFAQIVKQFVNLDNVEGVPVEESAISWEW